MYGLSWAPVSSAQRSAKRAGRSRAGAKPCACECGRVKCRRPPAWRLCAAGCRKHEGCARQGGGTAWSSEVGLEQRGSAVSRLTHVSRCVLHHLRSPVLAGFSTLRVEVVDLVRSPNSLRKRPLGFSDGSTRPSTAPCLVVTPFPHFSLHPAAHHWRQVGRTRRDSAGRY